MTKFLIFLFLLSTQALGSYKFTYSVPDIVCPSCEKSIDSYLKSIRTVVTSKYNHKLKTVELELKENKPLTKIEMKNLDQKNGYRILEIKKKKSSQ